MATQTIICGEVQGAGLLADIAIPAGSGPFPVLVGVHGGRWHYGKRSDLGIAIDVEQWAALGFFAMSIDYRLVTCTPAPACYQDTLCAVRWVHAHAGEYGLDRDRVYLTGMSAGGYLVSLAATLGEDSYLKTGGWEDEAADFRAAISVSGGYDLLKLDWACGWITPGVTWDYARTLGSPIANVKANKTKPMLLFHSDDDGSVPIDQAVRMAATLADNGIHHRFLHYPDRGHISLTEDFVVQETLKFISEIET